MQKLQAIERLRQALGSLRDQLVQHEVYHRIRTQDDLRTFMEHHVFAVWDFMSLLKALQGRLTGVTVPWLPQGDRNARRLINEIVLEEESDEDGEGDYISHFELYRAAMAQCGADTSRIDELVRRLHRGEPVLEALDTAGVPEAAQGFVRTTWRIIELGSTHSIAAAFTFGREDLIPEMFRALVADLHNRFPGPWNRLRYYLERHIHLDEEHHSPLAIQMVAGLCGNDEEKWSEAEETARVALSARIALWNGVVERITLHETALQPARPDTPQARPTPFRPL